MRRYLEIKVLLILVLLALIVNGYLSVVALSKSNNGRVAPLHPALAKITPSYYYAITEDTYIITTDTTGQNIYLYYFEKREPKEDSKLYYLKHISARQSKSD